VAKITLIGVFTLISAPVYLFRMDGYFQTFVFTLVYSYEVKSPNMEIITPVIFTLTSATSLLSRMVQTSMFTLILTLVYFKMVRLENSALEAREMYLR
jgi:hypothetical protein